MMKRLLTTFLAVLAIAGFTITASVPQQKNVTRPRGGVKLTEQQLKTILAVQPWMGHKTTGELPSSASRHASIGKQQTSPLRAMKVNPSGSKIQGWRTVAEYSGLTRGWHELGIDGSERLLWEYHDPDWVDDGWSDEPDFPFQAGFYHDGKVYGFHSEMLLYWLVWGHGTFTLDGQISDYVTYGEDLDVQDFSTYVITCAYDQKAGKAYAYTLNADATGYMFQSVDIDTWTFDKINGNLVMEDVCVGFCYNPTDGKLYGMTPDARLVNIDAGSGELTQVAKYDLPISTATQGITYSPLDKCFFFVSSTGDDLSTLYTIDPADYKLEKRSDLPDVVQYRILITPDKVVDPKSPLVAEIVSISFPEGAQSGEASLRIPEKAFDGSTLSGTLQVVAYIDGTRYSETDVQPGTDARILFDNIAEGLHRFSFTVKSGELESAEIEQTAYVGFDTPKTPQNILLSEGVLTWDAVTEGINGGYVDADALTYNAYLNDSKINATPIAGCKYEFDMPDEVYRKYMAQVEAVNHGHLSERGSSNEIKYGNPFPLPFTVQPTAEESELFFGLTARYGFWMFMIDAGSNNVFECYTLNYSGEEIAQSFFTPAIAIPETDKLVEVSFEVSTSGYDDFYENIEVGFGNQPASEAMTAIKQWDNLDNEDWKKLSAWFCPEKGNIHIGFTTRKRDHCQMVKLRNLSVKISDRPASTPAGVSELEATAMPEGELRATVTFMLPSLSVAGTALSGQLTATVKSTVETKTVSGEAGTRVSIDIATVEGINEISVYASNDADGIEEVANVFTGIDIPKPLDGIRVTHTADFRGLHLEWDAPVQGINGGYINTDKVTYSLCLFNEENYQWEIAQDLGTVNGYDYIPTVEDGMKVVEVAILTANEKGNCGTVLTASGIVGKPFALPFEIDLGEDAWDSGLIGLFMGEMPDDSYVNKWGYYLDPSYWVSQLPPAGGAFIAIGSGNAKSRIVLPAFSTENMDAAGIELSLWGGSDAAEIRVYACAYGMDNELIGTFAETETDSWYKKRFHLPSRFMGKEWVELKIEAVFGTEETVAAFGQFKIKTFVSDDIAVTGMDATKFPYVGSLAEITANIENYGLQAATTPLVELIISQNSGEDITMTMTRVDGEGDLPEFGEATYRTTWTPGAEAVGDVSFTVRLRNPDMDPSNNEVIAYGCVGIGNNAVVTDLTADGTASGVVLRWTDPAIETGFESFENMIPFSYGDRIGDFKTISLDGSETSHFGNFTFPYDKDAKAWQVISEAEMTEIMQLAGLSNDGVLAAASGDRFIFASFPYTIFVGADLTADRWIISPEVKGGSTFSFMMSAGVTGYIETVDVMYSATEDNTESFEVIETERILSAGWRKYEYTLPEDARYFAVRYRGNSDEGFFVMLDDIGYEPAEESPVLAGYDIYRNGTLVAEAANVRGSWTDSSKPDATVSYNIKPVVLRNGILTRGLMSNTATVEGTNGKDDLLSGGSINGSDGYIVVKGFAGAAIDVYTPDGIRVAMLREAAETEMIPVAEGLYIVQVGGNVAKVMVR